MPRHRPAFAVPPLPSPVWTLVRCQLNMPAAYLYLLVGAPPHQPLAAALTQWPMGTRLGAWLAAATIGRTPPATLRVDGPMQDPERPAMLDWTRTSGAVIAVEGLQSPEDSARALVRSAFRALEASDSAGHKHLPFEAAQSRLERWYRKHGGR